MKTIETFGFNELTQAESVETDGGIEVITLTLAIVGSGIGCFMLGYTIGKAIF